MTLLHGIGVLLTTPPILLCDNLNALYITPNPVCHARTKHNGTSISQFIPASLQLAGIFTKALSKTPFCNILFKLGVFDQSHS